MAYVYLFLAIFGELLGTSFLKSSQGFTVLLPSLGVVCAYSLSFYFFSKSLLTINLSIAYATWCGVGIIAATLISAIIFKEGITGLGIIGIGLVVAGVIILNLFGTAH
ncbi:MAG: multidrug efflux SMR transporter [Clostridiales bacterium]